jgi:hypothetical protein
VDARPAVAVCMPNGPHSCPDGATDQRANIHAVITAIAKPNVITDQRANRCLDPWTDARPDDSADGDAGGGAAGADGACACPCCGALVLLLPVFSYVALSYHLFVVHL